MIDWILSTVPLVKAIHIVALIFWCGGLMVLPVMLSRHDPTVVAEDYRLIRRATHALYTALVTPAAVITVIAGTWLIFMRGVFVPWLYAKLVFVALLVVAHAWMGHVLTHTAETPGDYRPPSPAAPILAVLGPALCILVLVLGKPQLGGLDFPTWLTEPRDRQFPFAVPSR